MLLITDAQEINYMYMLKFMKTSQDSTGCVALNNYSIAESQHIHVQGLELCHNASYSVTNFLFSV